MAKQKTHEEYVNEIAIKNPTVEVVGIYAGSRKKIQHRCLRDGCGYEWLASPHDILQGCGCPKCAGNIKRTHEEFVDKMKNINPNILILGEYINASTKIECKCLIDGCNHIWSAKPSHLLDGHGCPKCAHRKLGENHKLSNDVFVQRIAKLHPNLRLLSEYIDSNTKVKYECLIDGYIGFSLPYNLERCGCPRCSNAERYTTQSFREKILSLNPDIYVVGEYKGSTEKIECLCLCDGCHWFTEPRLLIAGYGCPQCYETKGEKDIRLWLEKYNVNYKYQQTFDECKDKRLLPFDFYLPEYNIAIEYQGRQHYEPVDFAGKGMEHAQQHLEYIIRHDNIKKQYCIDNNINLLCIRYDEDIEEVLINFLFI